MWRFLEDALAEGMDSADEADLQPPLLLHAAPRREGMAILAFISCAALRVKVMARISSTAGD